MPILLPNFHPFVTQLIEFMHQQYGHAGIQFMMSKLREKYWIMQGRRAVRKVVSSCVKCRRFTTKPAEVTETALPEDRVRTAKAFEVTGVDLAGPLFLQDGSKVWLVLYTCAVYRAVHLELVTSLSTEEFILALIRFIGRRGRPSVIHSDNGTNFAGASNL